MLQNAVIENFISVFSHNCDIWFLTERLTVVYIALFDVLILSLDWAGNR